MPRRPSLVIMAAVMLLASVIGCMAAEAKGDATKQATGHVSAKSAGHGESDDFIASLEAGEKAPEQTKESSMPVTVIGFIFKLALVLALCYATILGLKRFSGVKNAVGATRSHIKVMENSSLGANRTLHLIEIGSRKLLVASTPNQVSLLIELDADDITDVAPDQPIHGFKDQLSLFLGNKIDTTKSADSVAGIIRESTAHMQQKVREAGSFRRMFRDAENH